MPAGRPSVITKEKADQIAELLLLAFTDSQIALMVGVCDRTIRKVRTGELFPAIKIAALRREAVYRKKIWAAKGFWQGAAWFLERKYPEQFAKPEIQLSFANNYTQNNLSITIASSEAKEIEAIASPVRDAVRERFKQYRPMLNNGNGGSSSTTP